MAENKDKKDEKPSVDYNKLNKDLHEHFKGKHLSDISERLLSTYLTQKKKIYEANGIDNDDATDREFKMTVKEAEGMANSLYDTLIHYAAIKHYKIPKKTRDDLSKVKGHDGLSPLEALAESAFGIQRNTIREQLMKKADADESFSEDYIRSLFKESLEHYHGRKGSQIITNKYKIGSEHIDELKKQSESLIEKHGLDKGDYKRRLKSRDFKDIMDLYGSLAGQYYKPIEDKKK